MLDGVTGLQQRHLHVYPIILISPCRGHNPLSIKGKNFSKYREVTKTLGGERGGGGSNHPIVPRWGYEFACTSEG